MIILNSNNTLHLLLALPPPLPLIEFHKKIPSCRNLEMQRHPIIPHVFGNT